MGCIRSGAPLLLALVCIVATVIASPIPEESAPEAVRDPSVEDNLAGSESRVNEVRVPYEGDHAELEEEDQEAAATGDEESQAVARSEDTAEGDNEAAASDTSDRDKRFLFFGGGDSSSSSGGGSGNFLFDIIRLITGSGSTDSADDAAASTGGDGASAGLKASAAVDGGDAGASVGASAGTPAVDPNDGYTSGIPGPLTRLFIIANRGISNLLQDLILRLSQTSERIVNFKARLITALI